jgi:hypothetical protein
MCIRDSVGSEMCIRDSPGTGRIADLRRSKRHGGLLA